MQGAAIVAEQPVRACSSTGSGGWSRWRGTAVLSAAGRCLRFGGGRLEWSVAVWV